MSRPMVFMFGVAATLIGIGLIASGAEGEMEEHDTLRGRARDFFKLETVEGVTCGKIEYTGTTEEATNFLSVTMKPYIDLMYERGKGLGITDTRDLAAYLLTDLFPDCPWPPAMGVFEQPSQHLLWAAMIGQITIREQADADAAATGTI